jgi:hypothetical protein
MEAECLSETSVPTFHNTRYHNQEDTIRSFRPCKPHSIEGTHAVFHSAERPEEVWRQIKSCRQNCTRDVHCESGYLPRTAPKTDKTDSNKQDNISQSAAQMRRRE